MNDYTKILIRPIISEKANNLKSQKKYVFEVSMDSNKIQIKKAVEDLYKVKVEKVNTMIVPPKYKRVRMKYGYTKYRKKAIVTLKSGEIDFYKI